MIALRFPKGDSVIYTTQMFQFIISPRGFRSVCISCEKEMVPQGRKDGKWFICPLCGRRACTRAVRKEIRREHPSVVSEILRKERRDRGRAATEEKFGDRLCCKDREKHYYDRFLEAWRCGTCHFIQEEVVA